MIFKWPLCQKIKFLFLLQKWWICQCLLLVSSKNHWWCNTLKTSMTESIWHRFKYLYNEVRILNSFWNQQFLLWDTCKISLFCYYQIIVCNKIGLWPVLTFPQCLHPIWILIWLKSLAINCLHVLIFVLLHSWVRC